MKWHINSVIDQLINQSISQKAQKFLSVKFWNRSLIFLNEEILKDLIILKAGKFQSAKFLKEVEHKNL